MQAQMAAMETQGRMDQFVSSAKNRGSDEFKYYLARGSPSDQAAFLEYQQRHMPQKQAEEERRTRASELEEQLRAYIMENYKNSKGQRFRFADDKEI